MTTHIQPKCYRKFITLFKKIKEYFLCKISQLQVCLNMDMPLAPTLYTFSTIHCMTVSLAYNGEGLGIVWGRQKAEEKLKVSGNVAVNKLKAT